MANLQIMIWYLRSLGTVSRQSVDGCIAAACPSKPLGHNFEIIGRIFLLAPRRNRSRNTHRYNKIQRYGQSDSISKVFLNHTVELLNWSLDRPPVPDLCKIVK